MRRKIILLLSFILSIAIPSSSASASGTYSSTTAGTHALELTSGSAEYTDITVTKTGDVSGQSDNYDWQGTNAAVHASGGGTLTISGSSTITSNASYGNAVFSYGGNLNGSNSGDGTTIVISDASITTSSNNSGGIMATGGGIITASDLTITTTGNSSAAIRSDKGGGTITVSGGTYTTSGQGSPAIYSTAEIIGSDVTLKSNVAQVVVIEGGNSVTLTDSTLTANHNKLNGQDTTYQAILIYQSMSGDASEGSSAFTMTGGSITNTKGDIFHATNTTCTITLSDVTITNNDSSGYFLRAASDSWGNSGSNGGKVTLNATDQTITGTILVDSVSSLSMNLSGSSAFNGAVNTSGQKGTVSVTIASGSSWTLTANSYVSSLTNNGTITAGSYKLYVNGTEYTDTSDDDGGDDNDDDGDDDNNDDDEGTAPSITTTSLSDATVSKQYRATLKASGTDPITWTADDLPDGLTLSSSGVLSGKPTEAGTYSITFTAENSAGTDETAIDLTVIDVKPVIAPFTAKKGAIDVEYTLTFKTSAGTGDITWELSGTLPDGLEFDEDTATISGIPTEAITAKLTITATNTGGSSSKTFTLEIRAIKPQIVTKNLEKAVRNEEYEADIIITGTNPMSVTVTGLPSGLEFDADERKITGAPETFGTFSVRIAALNSSGRSVKSLKLIVYSAPVIDFVNMNEGTEGKIYRKKFTATGTKYIRWSIADGDIPEGMKLLPSSGILNGKPTEYGTFDFTLQAENSYGTGTKDVSLVINPVAPKISGAVKRGVAGSLYESTLKASGSTPVTWTIEGDLPEGITFEDGTFSGTPEKYFSGKIIVTAANDGGSDSKTYNLVITTKPPVITTVSLPSGTQYEEYVAELTATGTPDIVWSWSGYPYGLELNSETGEISGTPYSSGTFRIKVTAKNGARGSSKVFKLVVAKPSDTTTSLPSANEIHDDSAYVHESESRSSAQAVSSIIDVYEIVAELHALSFDESGMYDFDVCADESVSAGGKLFWFAFPKDGETASDDEIAEFYDESGAEIETLPENRKFTVSAWFRKNVTYEPVIAVKREQEQD